jgi:anthranilate phosphoribosyltransferase
VAGIAVHIKDGIAKAAEALDSCKAKATLDAWVRFSRQTG